MSKRFKAPAVLALAAALCGALTFGAPTPALADTSAQLQAKLDAAKSKLDDLYDQADAINEQLNGTKVQLAQTNAAIDQANTDIAQTEKDIEAKKAELAERQSNLAAKVAQDYKNGTVSFLSIILNATSFDDFVSRVHYADKVSEKQAGDIDQTKQLQAELNDKNIQLTAQKQQLEQQKAQQEQLQADQESQQAQLEAQASAAQDYVDSLDTDVQAKLAEEQEAERQAAAERAAAAQAAASSSTGSSSSSASTGSSSSTGSAGSSTGGTTSSGSTSSGSTSGGSTSSGSTSSGPTSGGSTSSGSSSSSSGSSSSSSSSSSSGSGGTQAQRDAVINAALSKCGGTYVYGACDPVNNRFDCSGFTMWVYSQVGISLPHQSEAQQARISNFKWGYANLRRGDLIWKSGHVGVYAGNGMLIDAGNERVGISLRNVYAGNWGGGWPA